MKNVVMFAVGAAVGAAVTWKLVEKKYKDLADEEIKSVVEHYKKRYSTPNEQIECEVEEVEEVEAEPIEEDITVVEYKNVVEDLGYQYKVNGHVHDSVYIDDANGVVLPFVIAPEDFGDSGYTTKTWYYYSDCILVDDTDTVVTNPTEYIGEALSSFGEYEDDAVHVRDIEKECDYEIIKCETPYIEANKEA